MELELWCGCGERFVANRSVGNNVAGDSEKGKRRTLRRWERSARQSRFKPRVGHCSSSMGEALFGKTQKEMTYASCWIECV